MYICLIICITVVICWSITIIASYFINKQGSERNRFNAINSVIYRFMEDYCENFDYIDISRHKYLGNATHLKTLFNIIRDIANNKQYK